MLSEKKNGKRKCEENYAVMDPVKLVSTDNQVNADMLVGLLKNKGIPCYVKDLETGNYMSIYMGFSVFGKEIYVDRKDYEGAKKLVDFVQKETEIEVPEADKIEEKAGTYSLKRAAAWFTLVMIGGGILVSLGLELWRLFQ